MKRLSRCTGGGLIALFLFLVISGCGLSQPPRQEAEKPVEIMVSAALGLKEVLLDIQKRLRGQTTECKNCLQLSCRRCVAIADRAGSAC